MNSTILRSLMLIFAAAMLLPSLCRAQCTMFELPLGERFRQSRLVAEGTVIGSAVFRNSATAMIYTAYRVSVRAVYKSTGVVPAQIDIITEGGVMGENAVSVIPSADIGIGLTAVFFLTEQPDATPFAGELPERFGLYGSAQGVLTLDADGVHDVFRQYRATELRQTLQRLAGKRSIEFAPAPPDPSKQKLNKSEKTLAASITSFSPSIITGGTFDTLTIVGSGFGNSYTGNARVAFRNADDGGATTINAPTNHIVSWTNTQIKVIVPPGAGTGTVRVTAVDNTQSTSAQTLTVYYSLIDAVTGGTYSPSWLANIAGGGYVVQFNTGFHSNLPAVNAFRRATTSWRCATLINITPSYTPTSISCNNGTDGVCVVTFGSTGCPAPAGTLAATYLYWTTCNGTNWHIKEFDMIVAPTAPGNGWNFGPGATTGGRYDLESVMLHELGHAHQLGHIINSSKVMNYSIGPNSDKRVLSQEDIDGGLDVMVQATATRPCTPSPMTPLTPATCQLPIAPEAAFSAVPTAGCSPVTVQFTDQSTNTPTAWQWDIDNDGTTDYTTQNPTHTYATAGTYTVRLTASNVAGTSTLTQTNLITVYPKPQASAGQDASACYGSVVQLGGNPSATGGTPPYTYLWTGTGSPFLSSATIAAPTIALNFSGSVMCILTVTDTRLCTTRDTVIITAFPQIFADAGNDKSFCRGGSALLGATPSGSGGRAPLLYSWSPGVSLNDSTIQRPIATPSQTTNYVLSVRDANGCIVTDSVRVTVFPAPTLSAGRDTTLCAGIPHLLGGAPTAAGGAPPFIYSWLPVAGLSSAAAANPIATPATTTRYILTVTDANNCLWYDTVSLSVLPTPTVVIVPSRTPNICDGDTITLNAGSGFASYRWSTGATTQTIKVWEQGTYSVEVTNASGCSAVASNPVNVIRNPRPMANIVGPTSVCASSSAVYSSQPEPDALYEWTASGGKIIAGQGQNQITVQWDKSNGTVILNKSFGATGCASLSSLGVGVGSTLKPILTATKTSGCEGDTIILDAPQGYQSYRWSTGATGKTIAVTTTGKYALTVTDQSGCTGTSDSVLVTLYPPPSKPFINRRGDTLFCTQADAYQWWREGTILPGETRQFLPVFQVGNYGVTIRNVHGCSTASSDYTVGSLSGVCEIQADDMLKVYPNPFDDNGFTIEYAGNAATFEVFSATGMHMTSGILGGAPATMTLARATQGVYLVVVRFGSDSRFIMLTKLH